jgi:hypothetical protein
MYPSADSNVMIDLFLGKHGRDKAGHEFLAEACQIGQELGLFDSHTSHTPSPPSSPHHAKLESVRGATAWALFNFQLYVDSALYFDVLKS